MGKLIRALRLQRGWSLTALAQRAGLSVSFLSDVETGRKIPTITSLERICAGFGMTPAECLRLAELPPHLARLLGAARSLEPEQADQLAAFLASLSAPKRREAQEEGYADNGPSR